MAEHTLTVIAPESGDLWERVYWDGTCIYDGHRASPREVLEAVMEIEGHTLKYRYGEAPDELFTSASLPLPLSAVEDGVEFETDE